MPEDDRNTRLKTVCFQPGDRTIDVPEGISLAHAAAKAGIDLRTDCGGAGTCGKCKVHINGQACLACQTTVSEDLEVFVPDASIRSDERTVVIQEKAFLPSLEKISSARNERYGVALDIGTTTLAAELLDLSSSSRLLGVVSRANPQRSFGDDVITRIQKVIEQPPLLETMQSQIASAVDEMLAELAEKGGIAPQEISLLSVAGNTVMECLFLGIDPSPLGFFPFTPPMTEFPINRAARLGLNMSPEGAVEVLPVLGGFVGGDIVAGILATDLTRHEQDDSGRGALFQIDIGTNGELVLSHNGNIYAAATAAGPAFEGGQIEQGTWAVPGAVDRVRLEEDGSVHCGTIGDRPAVGLCGSGLIDAAAELLRCGLIEPSGRFSVKPDSPFMARWHMIENKPAFELVPGEAAARREPICLTQRDVRQLQLATGAIRAGIRLLLRYLDLEIDQVQAFYVAGGFGSYIRPESAKRIGLFPAEVPLDRILFCGNTSLAGARLALLDPKYAEKAREIARNAEHIDLASLPDFANLFAESMIFE